MSRTTRIPDFVVAALGIVLLLAYREVVEHP